MVFDDEYFMKEALKEAKKAAGKDEVPIGAVIVCRNTIIARAHNLVEQLKDPTAHAEMQAFTAASNYLQSKYLKDCTLYVTIEPCNMCAGAAYWVQISRIVFGASDPKRGFSNYNKEIIHPTTQITQGILKDECSQLVQEFFQNKRT